MELNRGAPNGFHHAPLDLKHDTIRLILLKPKALWEQKHHGRICLNIEHHEVEKCPPYRALSYVWGPPKPQELVILNDKSFYLRLSLHHFLSMYLERILDTEYFWIDQLSIDQSNNAERNHQVAMMGDIFQAAARVVSCLGPCSAQEDLSKLEAVRIAATERRDPLELSTEESCSPNFDEDFGEILTPLTESLASATMMVHRALIQNTYWTRLWIVQEVILAGGLSFFRGPFHVARGEMEMIMDFMLKMYVPITTDYPLLIGSVLPDDANKWTNGISTVSSILRCRTHGFNWKFNIVGQFCHLSCTNPRDKIFGLMGLVVHNEAVQVDYTASLDSVFAEAFASLLAYDDVERGDDGIRGLKRTGLCKIVTEAFRYLGEINGCSEAFARDIEAYYDAWCSNKSGDRMDFLCQYLSTATIDRLLRTGIWKREIVEASSV
jgi:hypothetical protein